MIYQDRRQAGAELAKALSHYRGSVDLVLGLPRGGVPVAREVARLLEAPLDALVVRKVGYPHHPEVALGAVTASGVWVANPETAGRLPRDRGTIQRLISVQLREARRVERRFRPGLPPLEVAGKRVILVDDGLATGSTMLCALMALRPQHPQRLVVAVPVAPPETVEYLSHQADEVVCPLQPKNFGYVGQFYKDFRPAASVPEPDDLHHFARPQAKAQSR
ncbi:MAG: phosphoribosyltransferase [Vulcanimicrobiota bacterium]